MRDSVTIRRLRPAYPIDMLAAVYSHAYDHTRWEDHVHRVAFTRQFIANAMAEHGYRTVADLSCGDGAIALGLSVPREDLILGDFVAADHVDVVGRIEDTVLGIPEVDLFILSETIEHIDQPQDLLLKIRDRAKSLVLTTPLDEQDDGNPEHYWGWDQDGVESLLEQAGWCPSHCELFTPQVPQAYYTYQVWMATRDQP